MAKYTIELGTLLENNFDIGLRDYPIYKEENREVLNNLIKEHFYFREIGFETPEKFKRKLNQKMNEIMPLYNQRFKSEDVKFNPLYNIEIIETYEHKRSEVGKGESNSDSVSEQNANNIVVNSDTPQAYITNTEIKANKYASETENGTSEGNSKSNITGTSKSEQSSNESYSKKTEGSSAGLPFSKAIKQWRDVMLNINMEIINELEPLFMGIW